jgi:hypothetical protein
MSEIVQVTGNLANWSDSIGRILSYRHDLSDTVNLWSDTIIQIFRYHPLISEDLNQWVDLASLIYEIKLDFLSSSGSSNWADSLNFIPNITLKEFQDRFLITDDLRVKFNYLLELGDYTNLLDILIVVYQFLLENSDQIIFNDAITTGSSNNISIGIGDGLSMSDSLGSSDTLMSDSFINYLRRYLNDVPR